MRTYRAQKGALTRAINSGDPHWVIAEVERFYDEYEQAHMPLPDAWHRWNIAEMDAKMELLRRP